MVLGQLASKQELYDVGTSLLMHMENELQRECLSLSFCDAWLEFEHLMCELDADLIVDKD